MGRRLELTGQRFGKLVAIKVVGKDESGCLFWKCRCDCGEEPRVKASSLISGYTKSCGCLSSTPLEGQEFGELRVIEKVGSYKDGSIVYKCQCSCGNIKNIKSYLLNNGKKTHCGCKNKIGRTTHELSRSRFYGIWRGVKDRCDNSKSTSYKNYGAKGVKYQESWAVFENFKSDMYESYLKHCDQHTEKDTSIDRIENNKGYYKDNCRWATRREQDRNVTRNVIIDYKGEKFILKDLADKYFIKFDTLRDRLKRGLSIEEALTTPIRGKSREV